MKTPNQWKTVVGGGLGVCSAALLLTPLAIADEEIEIKTANGEVEIESDGEIETRPRLTEREARELEDSLRPGTVIAEERFTLMRPVSVTVAGDFVDPNPALQYRNFGTTLFGVDPTTNQIVDSVRLDADQFVVFERALTAVRTPGGRVILAPGKTPETFDVRGSADEVIDAVATASTVDSRERVAVLRKELGVIQVSDGSLIRLEADVLFDFDKATIRETAVPILNQVAELIRLSRDSKVEIAGYADAIGGEDYNLDLSFARANSVIDWMVANAAFPQERFRAIGRGEEGAVAPNQKADGDDNPIGRQQNRRVGILIRDQFRNIETPPQVD